MSPVSRRAMPSGLAWITNRATCSVTSVATGEVAAGASAAGRSRLVTNSTQTGVSSATTATRAAKGSEVRQIVIPRWIKDCG